MMTIIPLYFILCRMVSVNKVLPRMIPDYEELIASTGSIEAAVPPIAATSNLTAMSSSYMTAGKVITAHELLVTHLKCIHIYIYVHYE